jgi:HTH-type transcriptional regulator/antitoxin HipB
MHIRSPRELALAIASRRKKLGLSQKEVGDLVGLLQKTLSAFETRPESTKLETLFHILSAVQLEIQLVSKEEKGRTKTQWKQEW